MAVDSVRKQRLIETLRRYRLDAFVCSSPTDVLLLSGYWPVMGVSVAVFTVFGDSAVILPEDELDLALATSGARLVSFKAGSLDRMVNLMEALSCPLHDTLEKLGLGVAVMGVPMGQTVQPASYAVSAIFRSSLLDLLNQSNPRANYVACDDVLEQLKARKTPLELGLMEKGAKVASAAFVKAEQTMQAGARENEIAAAVQDAFQRCPDSAGLERSYGFFYCMSGPNAALASAAYARTRRRRVEEGDLVMIHANTCADGYWSDITRTYAVGPDSHRHKELREAVAAARRAALDCIRPGAAASAVDAAARTVLESHGMGAAFKHATGHGVGFAAANAAGRPRIHPHSPDILEEGMTFNIEPAVYFDGYGGLRHCDVVAVTSEGASVLTRF